jgi:hypothetical protein
MRNALLACIAGSLKTRLKGGMEGVCLDGH